MQNKDVVVQDEFKRAWRFTSLLKLVTIARCASALYVIYPAHF